MQALRTQDGRTRTDPHGRSTSPAPEGSRPPRGLRRSGRRGFKTGGGHGDMSLGGSIPLSYRPVSAHPQVETRDRSGSIA